MADETKDKGMLPDQTPTPAPVADDAAAVVAASPEPAVAPVGGAAHVTEQVQAKTAARRARKLATPVVADATPVSAPPPASVIETPVPATVAEIRAEDVAPVPSPDPAPVSSPGPAKASKPLARRAARPEAAPVRKHAPKLAIAAKPLPIRTAPAKAVPAKPRPAPVAAKAKPLVATRPGPDTPHAKVPAPLKTRVTHAAAPAASRKEHPIMTTANEFSEKFQSAFKDASEKAKTAFEKSQAAFGDAGEFAKGNVEAVVESSKILAAGLQELTKGYAAEGKSAMETLTAEIKELASAKSPTEFFEKHTALMRKQFDAAVAASSKHSEAVLKLANEAFQPISNRVSLAVEKMKVAA